MQKTILITGATDGIGLETAKTLVEQGHRVLLHGRNAAKLANVEQALSAGGGSVESFVADLSNIGDVDALANAVINRKSALDVLINNAGIFKTSNTVTDDGLDVRFMVNTIAPYRLTQQLHSILGASGRVINLSSAAQAPVDTEALAGNGRLADMEAYAQSKLAITMWSREMANRAGAPVVIAVNPGSMLGTKMVKEGFGAAGGDIGIGAKILCRLAVDDTFSAATGQYYDNDAGKIGPPHPDALDDAKSAATVRAIEAVIARLTGT